jgi:hypothetical protein
MPKRRVGNIIVKDEGILTGDDLAPSLGARTYREWIKKMTKESRAARIFLDGIAINFEPTGTPIQAQIANGAWIVMCDVQGCSGAEAVSPDDPIFFCFSCYNASNGYHVRPVEYPTIETIDSITTELMKRKPEHMHWVPGETAEDIKEQNKIMKTEDKLKDKED